jgi:hypothetical protein
MPMLSSASEISVRGVFVKVAAVEVENRMVVVTGRWPRTAGVKDEDWQEGEAVSNPDRFISALRSTRLAADIFAFKQKLTDTVPHYGFHRDWESVAAIPVRSYDDWWTNRVSTDLRCDVRKAQKRGVEVRPQPFTDEFVTSIVDIYDETPIRQGRPFWHYKRGFDAARRANSTYLDRSEFLAAYHREEVIGFLKIVYVDRIARLMQIVAKEAHRDKRPMNALLAAAVKRCEERGCSHLTYGKYRYEQGADSVTAFKHRNGFEEILVPHYFIPLTISGQLAIKLRLHRGLRAALPPAALRTLKQIRASLNAKISKPN